MKCIIVTPEKTVVDKEVQFVTVPLFDGEYGVAPLHTPVVGRLGAGELRMKTDQGNENWFVDGGFVEVLGDVVTLLTNRAVPTTSLTVERAKVALEQTLALKTQPFNDELNNARNLAVSAARNQLRIAGKYTK